MICIKTGLVSQQEILRDGFVSVVQMLSAGMYGLVLAGGVAIGVLGTAVYHDSTNPMVLGDVWVCEWHGCHRSDVKPADLVNPNGTYWGHADLESCYAWAGEAALDEVRVCYPHIASAARHAYTGEILRAAAP